MDSKWFLICFDTVIFTRAFTSVITQCSENLGIVLYPLDIEKDPKALSISPRLFKLP